MNKLVSIFVLLGLISYGTAQVCTETSYVYFFFTMCLNDVQCQRNFDLKSGDKLFFETALISEMLFERGLLWSDLCVSNETAYLWLGDMRGQSFCFPGEVRDEVQGCRPRHVTSVSNFQKHLGDLGFVLAEIAVIGIVVYTGLKGQIATNKEVRRRKNMAHLPKPPKASTPGFVLQTGSADEM